MKKYVRCDHIWSPLNPYYTECIYTDEVVSTELFPPHRCWCFKVQQNHLYIFQGDFYHQFSRDSLDFFSPSLSHTHTDTHSCCLRRRSLALLSASWSARPWGGSSLRPPRGAVGESAWPSRSRHSSAILWEPGGRRDGDDRRGSRQRGRWKRKDVERIGQTCRMKESGNQNEVRNKTFTILMPLADTFCQDVFLTPCGF